MKSITTDTFNSEIISLLLKGSIGVLPTDTVYGVVGLLSSQRAVEAIYKVKQRNTRKAVGTILIADENQIKDITNEAFLQRAANYWPGPTSVILPLSDKFQYAHKGLGSLPFRVPNNETLISFLRQTGPLATSSANLEGQPTAVSVKEAEGYFGEKIAFYVDGGVLSHPKPSRIITFDERGAEKVIRP